MVSREPGEGTASGIATQISFQNDIVINLERLQGVQGS